MKGRRTQINVSLNGQNISSDLDGDTLSLTFNDSAEERSDNLDFEIQNRDRKWLNGWFPNKMDTVTASINTENGSLDCGIFLVDEVTMSGRPLTVSIKGIAMPSDQDFSEVEHNKTWEKATLQEIASEIAGKAGIALEYKASYNPTIKFQTQEAETDKSFLQKLAAKHGISIKPYNRKLVLYEMDKLEAGGSIKTLNESDLLSWSGKTTITDTSYSGVSVQYINKNNEVMTYIHNGGGNKAPKIFKLKDQMDDIGMAQKVTQAKYKELNRGETTFSCDLPGDPSLVSGCCVSLSGDFGKFAGKYLIDSSSHAVSGGYVTSLELHKVEG